MIQDVGRINKKKGKNIYDFFKLRFVPLNQMKKKYMCLYKIKNNAIKSWENMIPFFTLTSVSLSEKNVCCHDNMGE